MAKRGTVLAHGNGETLQNALGYANRSFMRAAMRRGETRQRRPASAVPLDAPLIIIICCKAGKDRSPGISVVLENMFDMEGWVTTTTHLCQVNWRKNIGCRRAGGIGKCEDCLVKASAGMLCNKAVHKKYP